MNIEGLLSDEVHEPQANLLMEPEKQLPFIKHKDFNPNEYKDYINNINNESIKSTKKLDLSTIANNMQGEQIFALLSDAPLFYEGKDFKKKLLNRLISIGTFEEKTNEMINDKRELAELTVAAGETRISEMSNQELKELFVLSKY